MHKANILIVFGVLVILAPFSGLPLSWLDYIIPILGILVLIIGILNKRAERESACARSSEPAI